MEDAVEAELEVEVEEVVEMRSISWEGWRGCGEDGESAGERASNRSGEASRSLRMISRSASFMIAAVCCVDVDCGCCELELEETELS